MSSETELDTPARRMQSEMLKAEAIRFGADGQRDDPTRVERFRRIEAFIEGQKKQYPGTRLDVFVETVDHIFDASIASQGDRNFLRLNQKDLKKALSSDADTDSYLGLIGHEFSHLRNGDTQARSANYSPAKKMENEMRSDIEGAGPLGSANPEARAAYFRSGLSAAVAKYNEQSDVPVTAPTPADLRRIAEWNLSDKQDKDHPSDFTRLSAMEIEAGLMRAKKSMSVRTGNVDDPAQQSKWMADKLMQQYKDGTLPEPASLRTDPITVLPPAVKKQVEGMDKLPMASGADTPTTSTLTPAVAKDEQPVQAK